LRPRTQLNLTPSQQLLDCHSLVLFRALFTTPPDPAIQL
jgi:hypothetical protein